MDTHIVVVSNPSVFLSDIVVITVQLDFFLVVPSNVPETAHSTPGVAPRGLGGPTGRTGVCPHSLAIQAGPGLEIIPPPRPLGSGCRAQGHTS